MQLLDAIFIPDHILQMVAQDGGQDIMIEAGQAYEAGPELFHAMIVWGRIGAGLTEGLSSTSSRDADINEGRRLQTLDILALIKCAQMEETELSELISLRSGE